MTLQQAIREVLEELGTNSLESRPSDDASWDAALARLRQEANIAPPAVTMQQIDAARRDANDALDRLRTYQSKPEFGWNVTRCRENYDIALLRVGNLLRCYHAQIDAAAKAAQEAAR